MTKASDDLADALFFDNLDPEGFPVITREELRTLAREAEAMGAKRALEEAAKAAEETLEWSDRWVKTWLIARARAGQIGEGGE